MKKLLVGIVLLTSVSTFAGTLECGLFKGLASGTPIKTAKANLDNENIYVYETNQEEKASLSIVSQIGNFVRIRISQPEDFNEVILDKGMLLSMEERKSFGLVINGANEGKMTAVCYKGKAPFTTSDFCSEVGNLLGAELPEVVMENIIERCDAVPMGSSLISDSDCELMGIGGNTPACQALKEKYKKPLM